MGDISEDPRARPLVVTFLCCFTATAVASVIWFEHEQGSTAVQAALHAATLAALLIASGLFAVAGVLRLVGSRLVGDSRDALIGAALVIMGGLCLPLGGLAYVFQPIGDDALVGTGTRAVASLVSMCLVVRALRTEPAFSDQRPGRLLLQLCGLIVLSFLVLLAVQGMAPGLVHGPEGPAVVLAGVRAAGWWALSAFVFTHAARLPWARRAAPLFAALGVAEALRGLDAGRTHAWTFAALLVCAAIAALSARSAMADLDAAIQVHGRRMLDLTVTMGRAVKRAEELAQWREQVAHDARGACAGVRATFDILERYDDRIDAATSEQLRLAAFDEITHIEHLVTRTSDQPAQTFDALAVASSVTKSARALGDQVSLTGAPAAAVGRPADLAAALRNVLANARYHASGSPVRLEVVADATTVRIICADDGPGVAPEIADRVFERGFHRSGSQGSGLGLHGARNLLREQGGDLQLTMSSRGATFVATIPAAPQAHTHLPVRVPAQRGARPRPHLLVARTAASGAVA